jgi:tyrosyl-tRNA synthetase
MSKSLGNYIGIDEKPAEMYGKAMSIPDELIYTYFELVTDVSLEDLKKIRRDLDDPQFNPRDLKKRLGRKLVQMYHGEDAAIEAERKFEHVIVNKQIPDEIDAFILPEKEYRIDDLMIQAKTAASKSDARRLIQQGGVSVDGDKIGDPFAVIQIEKERILKVGKRKFARIQYLKA